MTTTDTSNAWLLNIKVGDRVFIGRHRGGQMTDFRTVIVPNELHNAINAKLTEAFADHPDAEQDRNFLYHELLAFFDEHGYLPDFSLAKAESAPGRGQ